MCALRATWMMKNAFFDGRNLPYELDRRLADPATGFAAPQLQAFS